MSDRSIKISILMPSLNVASYIRKSIESVLSQSLRDMEIICIDAGSTDGTEEIIEEYAKSDPRVKLLHSDIKSYGRQMNLGLDVAAGDYIGIVETDDFVEKDMFSRLYDIANETGSDVAKGIYKLIFEDWEGNRCSWTVDYIPEYIRAGRAFSPAESPDVHSWDRFIWNGIYRREFLDKNNIKFNETKGAAFQDISFQQIVLNEADRIVFIREPVYCYRSVRPGASTLSNDGIGYLYGEYNRIFGYKGLRSERLPAIKSRMLWAFVYEYEKALLLSGYDKAKTGYDDEIRWFLDKAGVIYEKSLFSRNYLSDHYEIRARRLLNDEKSFLEEAKTGKCILSEWLAKIKELKGNGRVIVCGCGKYGYAVIPFLSRNGVIPSSVMDSNEMRQGEVFFGFKIETPAVVIKKYPDALYVAAAKDSENMVKMLAGFGIDTERILGMDVSGLYKAMCLIQYPIPDESVNNR